MMIQNKEIPQGYKDSPLGIIPKEWEVKRLGDLFSFKNGINSDKENYGKGVKFVNTMDVLNSQYLTCESIRGAMAVDEKKVREFEVQYGDILFNRTSETPNDIGNSTVYLDTSSVVFGGFIIRAKCKDSSINHNFKMFCFKTDMVRKQIVSFGNGAIRYNIGQEDLAKVKFTLPPLPEQQKIAEILTCWDSAIEKQTQLIEKLETRKYGLMQQLLTGKKRLEGFEGKWTTVELGDVLSYQQPTPYLVSSTDYNDKHDIPVLTAGKTFILGYTNENVGIYSTPLPVIIFDDFTTDIKFVSFPFKVKSSAMKILTPRSNVNIVFVYAAMLQIKYAIGGHERHWISKYSYLTIRIPPISEQIAIANILSTADEEINKEKEKLAALKSHKKGLMQVLLTGKKRVKI